MVWDEGVFGFNNPVVAGLIEAITNSFATMEDYRILSFGTCTGGRAIISDYYNSSNLDTKAVYEANLENELVKADHSFNFLDDVKELATSVLGNPPDSATFIAYSIMHPKFDKEANIVRINPCLKPDFDQESKKYVYPAAYNTDETSRQNFLTLLDMDAVKQEQVALIIEMSDKFIVEDDTKPRLANQLIRGQANGNYLGDIYFKEAKIRWNTIRNS